MKRIPYVEFLDRLRERERARTADAGPLASAHVPRKRETTERLRVRMTPEQKAFVEDAAASTHDRAVSPSAIVSVGVAIVQELDVPWPAIASADELLAVVRRRLRSRA